MVTAKKKFIEADNLRNERLFSFASSMESNSTTTEWPIVNITTLNYTTIATPTTTATTTTTETVATTANITTTQLYSYTAIITTANLSSTTALKLQSRCHHIYPSPPVEAAFFGGILPAVCAIGAAMNVASYFVLRDSRRFKAPTYVYLTGLAVAQFLVLFSEMFSLFTMEFHHSHPYLELFYAEVIWPLFSFSCTLTQCLLCAITIDRYYFLKKHHPRSVIIKRRRQARHINYGLALAVCLLNWPRMFAYTFDFQLMCFTKRWSFDTDSWFSSYTNARTALFNFGSMILLIIFNCLLMALVVQCKIDNRQHALFFFRLSKGVRKRKLHERRLTISLIAAAMLGGIVEGYTFIFSPISIGVIWRKMSFWGVVLQRYLLKGGLVVLAAQCSANFVIYYMLNPTFRRQLFRKTKRAFSRCRKRMYLSIRTSDADDQIAITENAAASNSDMSSSTATTSAPGNNIGSSAFALSELPPLID